MNNRTGLLWIDDSIVLVKLNRDGVALKVGSSATERLDLLEAMLDSVRKEVVASKQKIKIILYNTRLCAFYKAHAGPVVELTQNIREAAVFKGIDIANIALEKLKKLSNQAQKSTYSANMKESIRIKTEDLTPYLVEVDPDSLTGYRYTPYIGRSVA